jgi:hypothetical protein
LPSREGRATLATELERRRILCPTARTLVGEWAATLAAEFRPLGIRKPTARTMHNGSLFTTFALAAASEPGSPKEPSAESFRGGNPSCHKGREGFSEISGLEVAYPPIGLFPASVTPSLLDALPNRNGIPWWHSRRRSWPSPPRYNPPGSPPESGGSVGRSIRDADSLNPSGDYPRR